MASRAKGQFIGLKLIGDWENAKAVLAQAPADMRQAIDAATGALAEFLAGKIKAYVGTNVPPPNSPFTLLMKRSSKTLINHGDLRNGIRAVRSKDGEWWVGVPAALGGEGKPPGTLARLANVLEEGRVIVQRMTPKQRRFLFATLGRKVSKVPRGPSTGILVIHIPPRPFIKPVYDEFAPQRGKLFEKYLRRNLKRLAGGSQ